MPSGHVQKNARPQKPKQSKKYRRLSISLLHAKVRSGILLNMKLCDYELKVLQDWRTASQVSTLVTDEGHAVLREVHAKVP